MILFSDTHFDELKPFSTILPGGINSRLADQVNVIHKLIEAVKETETKNIVFLGDLFNSFSPSISKNVYNVVAYLIRQLADVAELYLICGNHDRYGNTHVLTPYQYYDRVHIVANPVHLYLEGMDIDMVPWGFPVPEKKSESLMAHMDIIGAIVNTYGVTSMEKPEGVYPRDLVGYKHIYLGHFHDRQSLPVKGAQDAQYIGSIIQVTRGNRTEPRGYAILTDGRLSFRDLTGPNIYTVDVKTQANMDKLVGSILHSRDYWHLTVYDPGIKVPSFDHRVEIEYDVAPETTVRLEEKPGEDLVETTERFIDTVNTMIDKEEAKKFLREVMK